MSLGSALRGFWSGLRAGEDDEATVGKGGGLVPAPWIDGWSHLATAVGPFTVRKAMTFSAVTSAVGLIVDHVAGMRLQVFRRTESGREQVHSAPEVELLNDQWSMEETALAARSRLLLGALTRGAGYAYVHRDAMGRAVALRVLESYSVNRELMVNGLRRYWYSGEDPRVPQVIMPLDMVEVRYLEEERWEHRPFNPLAAAWPAIAAGLSAEQAAERHFGAGMLPRLAATAELPNTKPDQEMLNEVMKSLGRSRTSRDGVVAMPAGIKLMAVGGSARDAQLVEAWRMAVESVARVYRLAPSKLSDFLRATYNNAEQADLAMAKDALSGWARKVESQLAAKVLPSGWEVEHNFNDLLRADARTRWANHALAVEKGIKDRNEVRAEENLPSREGADILTVQAQMRPLAELAASTSPSPEPGGVPEVMQ